jgi:hypothetical protein
MRKIRIRKIEEGVEDIHCNENVGIDKLLVEVDRTDDGYMLFEEGEKKRKNIEEFYKTRDIKSTPKDIRSYLIVTDKIIDKEL